MLTIDQALQIATGSVRRTVSTDLFDRSQNATLERCGVTTEQHLDLFTRSVAEGVRQAGHTIPYASLRSIDRDSTIKDVVQTILAYSLPGDDTFEEPPDPPEGSGGDDMFEEPAG
jgi:hypothetical protein